MFDVKKGGGCVAVRIKGDMKTLSTIRATDAVGKVTHLGVFSNEKSAKCAVEKLKEQGLVVEVFKKR